MTIARPTEIQKFGHRLKGTCQAVFMASSMAHDAESGLEGETDADDEAEGRVTAQRVGAALEVGADDGEVRSEHIDLASRALLKVLEAESAPSH